MYTTGVACASASYDPSGFQENAITRAPPEHDSPLKEPRTCLLREGRCAARRVLQVLERHGAPADHPRLLAFPEGDYLDVIIARVVD